MRTQSKSSDGFYRLLGSICLSLALLWLLLAQVVKTTQVKTRGSFTASSTVARDDGGELSASDLNGINFHLKKGQTLMDVQESDVGHDNWLAPRVGAILNPTANPNSLANLEQQIDSNNPSADIADSVRDALAPAPALGRLEHEVDTDLADQEYDYDYNQKYEAGFAHEFIRNARARGLEVKLNRNLQVVEVQRRRMDTSRSPQSESRGAPLR